MSFLGLPNEMLLQVGRGVESASDLNSLILSSRQCAYVLNGMLYDRWKNNSLQENTCIVTQEPESWPYQGCFDFDQTIRRLLDPPIVWAVRSRNLPAAQRLVLAGADVNKPARNFSSFPDITTGTCHTLTYAVEYAARGAENLPFLRLLLDNGASIWSTSHCSSIAMGHCAVANSIASNNVEGFHLLRKHGMPFPSQNFLVDVAKAPGCNVSEEVLKEIVLPIVTSPEQRAEALQIAIYREQKTIVKVLLDQGLDVNGSGYLREFIPLVDAAGVGNIEIMEMLLERGADINKKCRATHNTPVSAATTKLYKHWSRNRGAIPKEEWSRSLRFLLAKGADVSDAYQMIWIEPIAVSTLGRVIDRILEELQ